VQIRISWRSPEAASGHCDDLGITISITNTSLSPTVRRKNSAGVLLEFHSLKASRIRKHIADVPLPISTLRTPLANAHIQDVSFSGFPQHEKDVVTLVVGNPE